MTSATDRSRTSSSRASASTTRTGRRRSCSPRRRRFTRSSSGIRPHVPSPGRRADRQGQPGPARLAEVPPVQPTRHGPARLPAEGQPLHGGGLRPLRLVSASEHLRDPRGRGVGSGHRLGREVPAGDRGIHLLPVLHVPERLSPQDDPRLREDGRGHVGTGEKVLRSRGGCLLVPAIKSFWDADAEARIDPARPKPSVRQYLAIEEFTVLSQIQAWTAHRDKALSDLARRFLERKRFAMVEAPSSRTPSPPTTQTGRRLWRSSSATVRSIRHPRCTACGTG